MKKFVKGLNIILMVCCLFVGGVIGSLGKIEAGATAEEQKETSTAENFYIEWSNGQGENILLDSFDSVKRGDKLEVVYSEYKTPQEYLIIFNNGSFVYVDEVAGVYSFTPVELGDWDCELQNMEQLQKIVMTYKSIYETGYY